MAKLRKVRNSMSKNFEIGQVVCFVVNLNILFQVLERVEKTCHGGTQVFYIGRIGGKSISQDRIEVASIELTELATDVGKFVLYLQDTWKLTVDEADYISSILHGADKRLQDKGE